MKKLIELWGKAKAYITNLFSKPAAAAPQKPVKVKFEEPYGSFKSLKHFIHAVDKSRELLNFFSKHKKDTVDEVIHKFGIFLISDYGHDKNYNWDKKERNIPKEYLNLIPRHWAINRAIHHNEEWVPYILVAIEQNSMSRKWRSFNLSMAMTVDKKNFYAGIDALVNKQTGEVRIMKEKTVKYSVLPNGKQIPHIVYEYPYFPPTSSVGKTDHTLQEKIYMTAKMLFIDSLTAYMSKEMGTNVYVTDGSNKIVTSVSLDRMPYFFKDRISVRTSSGRKKKIYHSVMSHFREYKSGVRAAVKMHYRGLRKFKWKDYNVSIVIPDQHNISTTHAFSDALPTVKEVENLGEDKMLELTDDKLVGVINYLEGWEDKVPTSKAH